jgi:hypothetical protein
VGWSKRVGGGVLWWDVVTVWIGLCWWTVELGNGDVDKWGRRDVVGDGSDAG